VTRRPTVLAYHAVGDRARADDRYNLFVSTRAFAAQMAYLARARRVVSLEEALDPRAGGGRPAVAITFDDAFTNVLTNGGPILAAHGFPATIFVPTAWIGREAGWVAPDGDLRVMDETELRDAMRSGFALESHGGRHAHMSRLPEAEARADVAESTLRLEEIRGRRPTYFAYPYGETSALMRDIVREAGYRTAFSIDRPGVDPFAYERTQITPFDGETLFAAKTSGRYLAVRHAPAFRAAYAVAKPLVSRLRRQSRAAGSDAGSGCQSDGE
jgi:peptidoglycan/xylan/chitin deacetylase (PgdA/CDA1 family)